MNVDQDVLLSALAEYRSLAADRRSLVQASLAVGGIVAAGVAILVSNLDADTFGAFVIAPLALGSATYVALVRYLVRRLSARMEFIENRLGDLAGSRLLGLPDRPKTLGRGSQGVGRFYYVIWLLCAGPGTLVGLVLGGTSKPLQAQTLQAQWFLLGTYLGICLILGAASLLFWLDRGFSGFTRSLERPPDKPPSPGPSGGGPPSPTAATAPTAPTAPSMSDDGLEESD
ncbi:MAG: hypothetical protein QOH61_497 [Chloroflexota bacterium]|jgi:hypothetical protein|nr:hypothetical protein [Chloroflexota bacterium]